MKAEETNGYKKDGTKPPALSILANGQLIPIEDNDLSQEEVAQILAQRAYELAKPTQTEEVGALLHLLLFQLNGGRYAIEVKQAREIFPLQPFTPVPRTPEFVLGVFSARGRLISLIDLGIILGLAPTAVSPQSKIVVVENQKMEVAFLADEVEDVTTIFADSLKSTPASQSGGGAHFTRGITDGTTAVLDLNAILNDPGLIINEEI